MLSIGVTKEILNNGLTVLIKENHNSPVVGIFSYVKAGYFNEPDRLTGISHLIEHMFFKGTAKRGVGQIAIETKELGGYLNASTIYDHTLYYTVLPSKNFVQGLDIQSDALLRSIFDPEGLRKETEVVIQEAKRKLDMPAAVAREKLFELAFDKHRMRRWRIGTEETLRALTREDFLTFYRNLYRPENIILVVVGDIETGQALEEIKKFYGGFEKGDLIKETSPPEPPQQHFKYRFLTGDIQQSYLAIGFHTPAVFHEDSYALELLAFLLGHGCSARLHQKIKEEKKLVNSISAYNYTLQDLGIFIIESVAQPKNLREAEIAITEEIANLQKNPISEEELNKARALIEAMYVFSMESVSGQANLLASYEALGDYHLAEDYLNKLYQVSQDDILRVAEKYLVLPNCSLLEYSPEKTTMTKLATAELENRLGKNLSEGSERKSKSPKQEKYRAVSRFSFISGNGKRKEAIKYQLDNGITLLVKENHQVPMLSLGIFAKGGRLDEIQDNAGITGLALRSSLKGTQNRSASQIAHEIENLGSGISLSHDSDYTSYAMTILSKHFEAGWAILTDVIKNPIFPEDELSKEQDNTIAAILRTQDDMFQYPVQLLFSALFPDHSYGLPAYGFQETIRSFSRENLLRWHHQLFAPENLIISVVGDVDSSKLVNLVESTFTGTSRPEESTNTRPSIQGLSKIQSNIEIRDKEQTALTLGFSGPQYTDADYYPLLVLQNVLSGLGGRFFEELRGRQSLAYTVSTYLVSRLFGGAFISYIATSPEKENLAKNGLLSEFEKLITEPISESELQQTIKYTVGTHQIGLETNRAQMFRFAHAELLGKGLQEVEAFPEKIAKVTREDIFNAAQKYFDLECYAEGIVRGKSDMN